MLPNHRYLALLIVIVITLFFAVLKSEVFDHDINCSDENSKLLYAKKAVLFVFTIILLFILTSQVSPR